MDGFASNGPATRSAPGNTVPASSGSAAGDSGAVELSQGESLAADSKAARRSGHTARQPLDTPPTLLPGFERMPLRFEPNHGQSEAEVDFLSRGSGYGIFLTDEGAVLSLQHDPIETVVDPEHPGRSEPTRDVFRMQIVDANPAAAVRGRDQLTSHSNYFTGSDREGWVTDVPNFTRVQYLDVYEGVDLAYHGDSQNRLEFDFTIRPGADPDAIQLSFEGWDAPTLDEDGNLAFGLRSGDLKLLAPVVYQVRADGQRDDVDAEFVLFENDRVGFDLGEYDPTRACDRGSVDRLLGLRRGFERRRGPGDGDRRAREHLHRRLHRIERLPDREPLPVPDWNQGHVRQQVLRLIADLFDVRWWRRSRRLGVGDRLGRRFERASLRQRVYQRGRLPDHRRRV